MNDDDTISISAKVVAEQRHSWVVIIRYICALAAVAIIALLCVIGWMIALNRSSAALQRQTLAALDKANSTIAQLTSDGTCRSQAAAAESAALSALVIQGFRNPDDTVAFNKALDELAAASAQRQKVAAEGCG